MPGFSFHGKLKKIVRRKVEHLVHAFARRLGWWISRHRTLGYARNAAVDIHNRFWQAYHLGIEAFERRAPSPADSTTDNTSDGESEAERGEP